VTHVIGGATVTGINKPGMDSRSLYYGPLLVASELIIAAAASTDFEIVRGLYNQVDVGMIATLTAAEIASPSLGILADVRTTYMLNVAPYTRYRSDGSALVSLGSGGAGATNLAATAAPTNVVVTSDTGNDATIPLADGTNAGLMAPAQFTKLAGIETAATADQTGAEMVTAINASLGGTTWQSGGASMAVEEGDAVIVAAATSLDFASADFDVAAVGNEANVAISAAIARILAPVTISTSRALTSADMNRTMYVDGVGLTLTIDNDASGGYTSDDAGDFQAIGSGSFTIVQGTATLTTDSGASAASATAVGKRVQFQRTGTSAWRTLSPAIVSAGGNTRTLAEATTRTILDDTNNNTVTSLVLGNLSAGTSLDIMMLVDSTAGVASNGTFRFDINGTEVLFVAMPESSGQTGRVYRLTIVVLTNTTVTGSWDLLNDQTFATDPYDTDTVSDVSAGATLRLRSVRTSTGKAIRLQALNVVVRQP
jgi:hypothetical protein